MAAFINALMEEGTKQDCLEHVVKLWDENCELRKRLAKLEQAYTSGYSDAGDDAEKTIEDLTRQLVSLRFETADRCAKICDQIAINAERRAAGHENKEAKQAAMDKMEAAQTCASAIRERVSVTDDSSHG